MKPLAAFALLLTASLLFAAAPPAVEPDATWLAKVPAKETGKLNPYAGQDDAISAGRRLFAENCAKCHGEHAEGRGKKPALTSDVVQRQATDGQLHWFIKNGNLGRGMPAWSRLPDQQLWQIVTYLKTLKHVVSGQ